MLKKNLKWTEDDFVIENNIIKKVKEEARDGKLKDTHIMVVPEGVIGFEANCSNYPISELYLPKSLKYIGENAFSYCSIRYIYGGENVEEIRTGAFTGNRLTEVRNFKNLVTIWRNAFFSCNIKKFDFHSKIKEIQREAFKCNKFEKLDLSNLEEATIGEKAFSRNMISELKKSDNLKIEEDAFEFNMLQQEEFKEPVCDKSWTKDYFIIKKNVITGITEEGIEKIKETNSLTIPYFRGINMVGTCFEDFGAPKELKNVYIEDGITSIASFAFKDSYVEYVRFPNTLIFLGVDAFYGSNLKYVDLSNTSLRTISANAFNYNLNLQEVKLPNKLELIEEAAFADTYSLRELAFPNSLEHIESFAFEYSGLRKINIGNNSHLEKIEYSAFSETQLQELDFTKLIALKVIEKSAFAKTNIKDVKIDNKNLMIGWEAFVHSGTESLEITSLNIELNAFALSNLKNLVIEDVYEIENRAFYRCDLENVEIKKLKEVSKIAFDGNNKIDLSFPEETEIKDEDGGL